MNRTADAGEGSRRDYPARGLAVGDLDNDGWPVVVVANDGAVPVVLRDRGGMNRWIGLDALPPGTIVRWPQGSRFVTTGGSYLSSQDPRVVIGLAGSSKLD